MRQRLFHLVFHRARVRSLLRNSSTRRAWVCVCVCVCVLTEMSITAKEVLSYKFIPVIYQLVARIGSKHKEAIAFQNTLHALVARVAADHPYHAVYQVRWKPRPWRGGGCVWKRGSPVGCTGGRAGERCGFA